MKIKELLDTERKWCKRRAAVDASGTPVNPGDTNAVRWCLMGAANKCYSDRAERIHVFKKLIKLIHNGGDDHLDLPVISRYNDKVSTTFTDIKNLLEEADA